jgi:hypothetical protein
MPSNPMRTRSKPTPWLASVAVAAAWAAVAAPAQALDYTLGSQYGPIGTAGGSFQGAVDVELSQFNGQLYIVDQNNHRVQRFSKAGVFIGSFGSLGNGNGQLTRPSGVAIDNDGNVYVADQDNNRVAKFSATGTHITNFGSFGSGDGQFNTVSLRMGIAYSAKNNVIFVTDARNSRIQRFSTAGVYSTKWGSAGAANNQYNNPSSVAVDADGSVYIADTGNNRIQKTNWGGGYLAKWGTAGTANGQFDRPSGVSVDATGIVYVADGGGSNKRVQAFTTTGTHLATYGSPSGTALNAPMGVVADADGTVWVVDSLGAADKIVNVLNPTYASDATPPVSTISQSPAKNASGFNNTDVTLTLRAVDEVGGSRVKEIRYTVNMGTEQVASFSAAPSVSTTFSFSAAGIYDITYWAVDFQGNVEAARTYTVTIDRAIPVVSAFVGVGELWIEASDDWGVSTIEYRVDNGDIQTYTGPVALPAGSGVVKYWARDLAGNLSVSKFLAVGTLLKSVAFAPAVVYSGATAQVTISLNLPAPTGGLPLSLSSSNPAVIAVPATVTVPAGATSVVLNIPAGAVSTETSATVTASTDSGQFVAGSVAVIVPGPKTMTVNPSIVIGGNSAVGTVNLAAKAPAGGVTVNLTSLDASATVPATVTVPAGSLATTFPITTTKVLSDRAALISAEADGQVAIAALSIRRVTLSTLVVTPTLLLSGRTATGTVTLGTAAPAGGITVALSSTNSAVSVPASVDIAEGTTSATFTATAGTVTTDTLATVRASYGGTLLRTTVRVTPGRLTGFRFSPATTSGGAVVSGIVTLSAPAPAGGTVVGLRSRNSLIAVPASITVPAGETTAAFTFTSPYVTANASAVVLAFTAIDSRTATFTAIPLNVSTVALNPATVVGGNSTEMTITLTGPAPAGGTELTLASSSIRASLPATVTVPEGDTSITVVVNTVAVTANTNSSLSAKVTAGTVTRGATLAITKP